MGTRAMAESGLGSLPGIGSKALGGGRGEKRPRVPSDSLCGGNDYNRLLDNPVDTCDNKLYFSVSANFHFNHSTRPHSLYSFRWKNCLSGLHSSRPHQVRPTILETDQVISGHIGRSSRVMHRKLPSRRYDSLWHSILIYSSPSS